MIPASEMIQNLLQYGTTEEGIYDRRSDLADTLREYTEKSQKLL